MSKSEAKAREALEAEVLALRKANDGLRQQVRELDARLVRQHAQYQEALAQAESKVIELRVGLAGRLQVEAQVAEERAAKGRPAAGQVGGQPAKG